MSLCIQAKVLVASKYVNTFKGQDGQEHNYFNVTSISSDGRPDVIGVSADLYNLLEVGKSYVLAGGCSGMGKSKNWWFNSLVKEADK